MERHLCQVPEGAWSLCADVGHQKGQAQVFLGSQRTMASAVSNQLSSSTPEDPKHAKADTEGGLHSPHFLFIRVSCTLGN